MEIKLTHVAFLIRKRLLKWLMRAFVFFCCFAVFGFAPDGALSQNVTIKEDKLVTVDEVFDLIMDQTNFTFVYQVDMFKNAPKVQLKKGIIPVDRLLEQSLSNTSLDMEVKDNTIVIKQKTTQPTKKTQGIQVSGKVTDELGLPMAGVSVIIKDTNRGVATDFEGSYNITVPDENAVLIFTYIGYTSQEITVGNQTVINVTLKEGVSQLDEVVLNAGYYNTTQRTKTGSISKVTAEDIEKQPVTNPLMALQGRVTGVDITPTNGVPGSAIRVQIRGQNTLRFDGGFPLYIIDGVPIDSRPIETGSTNLLSNIDPISQINPSNIKSIEILKDADATAIYGSRGANGVVLITTKDLSQKDVNIEFSVYSGIGEITNRLDLLNTSQYLEMRNEAFANDGATPTFFDFDVNGTWDQNRYNDWQDILLGNTSYITDVQGNLGWRGENTSYRFGGGFHKETMVFSSDYGFKRGDFHFALNHNSKNDRFQATLNLNYGITKNKQFNDNNFVNYALSLPPNAPNPYDENGNLNWEQVEFFGFNISTWDNPFSFILKTHEADLTNLIANGTISYELFSGLTFKSSFGYTELNGSETIKNPLSSMRPENVAAGFETASSIFGINKRRSSIIEPQINFNRSYSNHNLNFILGASWQESNAKYQSIQGSGYTSDLFLNTLSAAPQTQFFSDDNNIYKYNAFFTRLGYNYNNKYYLNLTGRRDGSSRFGPGKRYGNFGSIGAAWIFSNEKIFEDSSIFSFGKIRASYGITGNDQIGDYKYYDIYELTDIGYQNGISLYPTSLFNPDYAWEETKKIEVAIELELLRSRVFLEVDWYRNRSSNQLINYRLPLTTGFDSVLSNLDATVQNTGVEILLTSKNIVSKNFDWSTSFNITLPKNKLVEFSDIENSSYSDYYKVGESLSIQRLYTWLGVNPETGRHEILDLNEDGAIDDDDKSFMKPLDRKFYGGLQNNLRFKNFELSFLLQFSKQDGRLETTLPGTRSNQPVSVINHWQNEGDITNIAQYSQSTIGLINYLNQVVESDYGITDASYLRLKTLTLSYRVPGPLFGKNKADNLSIFLQGQNLFTFTNYEGFDPETGNNLPPLRILTLGLQYKF